MAFDYQTFEQGHIVAIRTEGVLTLDDIRDMDHMLRSHCHQIDGQVHVIADLMLTEDYPRNVVDLMHELNWVHENNLGWVIFLSQNHYLNKLLDTAMHMSGHNYLMLDDFSAAMSIVSNQFQPVH